MKMKTLEYSHCHGIPILVITTLPKYGSVTQMLTTAHMQMLFILWRANLQWIDSDAPGQEFLAIRRRTYQRKQES